MFCQIFQFDQESWKSWKIWNRTFSSASVDSFAILPPNLPDPFSHFNFHCILLWLNFHGSSRIVSSFVAVLSPLHACHIPFSRVPSPKLMKTDGFHSALAWLHIFEQFQFCLRKRRQNLKQWDVCGQMRRPSSLWDISWIIWERERGEECTVCVHGKDAKLKWQR